MKKTLRLFIVFISFQLSAMQLVAQSFDDILKNAENDVKNIKKEVNTVKTEVKNTGINTNQNNKGASLTSSEITQGLRQALQIGAKNATNKVAVPNGFFGNSLIKILMPPEARNVETTLRELGFGNQVDNAILSMNRGAEDASAKALPIFVNAITGMTIQDGLTILRGGNDAATQYLKAKTSVALKAAFLPIVRASLAKTQATRYWASIFKIYNELPTTFNKVNTDLPGYVTDKALAGVFLYIAEEEGKIRTNPAARINDILKKVFGAK